MYYIPYNMRLHTNIILLCTCAFYFLRSINTAYTYKEVREKISSVCYMCVCVCDLSLCSRDTQLLMCVKRRFLIHTCIYYIWRYYVIDDRPTVVERNVIFYTHAKIFSFVSTPVLYLPRPLQ